MNNIACHTSKPRILWTSSHHIAVVLMVSPMATQDRNKWSAQLPNTQPLQTHSTVHPEGIEDVEKQDSGPDSWGAYERNDSSEPRLLNLSIHRKVLKYLIWDIWFPFSSVQWLNCVQFFAIPWITARQASLSITNPRNSLRHMSIKSVMPSSHLILCCPLLLLPPIPSSVKDFSNESTLHMRWPKYWSISFSIIPSKEHPGLISFKMDWLDFLAVQGTLRSLLQHHSSKASIFCLSAFFTVQLLHPYMTTGKTIALTRLCWQK